MSEQRAGATILVPNWDVVTAPAARQALGDIIRCGKHESRFDGLDTQAATILAVILRHYAAEARPPTMEEIARTTTFPIMSVKESLTLLHRLDFVVVDRIEETIKGAYPFTERATRHLVTFTHSGKTVKSMCAIDALGAGPMCHEDVVLTSCCGLCGQKIAAHTEDHGMTLDGVTPQESVVWVSLNASYACAADTVCNEFLFFCCDLHLEQWRGGRVDGYRLSPEEAFQVGKALFVGRAIISNGAGHW
jgi:hypothetical protein